MPEVTHDGKPDVLDQKDTIKSFLINKNVFEVCEKNE